MQVHAHRFGCCPWFLAVLCAAGLAVDVGCTSALVGRARTVWVADYDMAEQRVRESGRELLIFYTDARFALDTSMERTLKSDPVEGMIADNVRCMLFKSYEPDRRYVAQYGVDRAPALILVHADGTCHAQTGSMSSSEIAEFLTVARSPGAPPHLNPHIPRQPRYHWHRTIEAAEEAAERTGRPMLIVVHRKLSHDWRRLKKLLSRHEVYLRLADLVHCRIGLNRFSGGSANTRFGALRLPALVIARTDGTFDVFERPTSYEAIVHFSEAALRSKGASRTN